MKEEWATIVDFDEYAVTTFGRVINLNNHREVKQSVIRTGALKVNLRNGDGYISRLVSSLVAEAFVPGHSEEFDTPMHLNMNYRDNTVWNLVWRPRHFVLRYSRQHREPSPHHYRGPVLEITEAIEYLTFGDAAIANGILVKDIWSSIMTGKPTFPTMQIFRLLRDD